MVWRTDKLIETQDRIMDRQDDWDIDKIMDRQDDWDMDRITDRQDDWDMDRIMDRQDDWDMDKWWTIYHPFTEWGFYKNISLLNKFWKWFLLNNLMTSFKLLILQL